jgi:flavin-dependent dehydrogenase
MLQCDVLVIGAGPAGSISAAMLQRAGFHVIVVEREKFPRFVIGESLLPRCMEVLEDAGFLEAVRSKNFQQKFGAKFLKGESVSDFNFTEQYTHGWDWTWQVPRAEFDQTLISEVERMGVPVYFESTVTEILFNEDETSLTTVVHKDGSIEKVFAKFVIDASGYGRVIPKLFNLDKPSNLDPRKALFAHVSDEKRMNFDEPNRIIVVLYEPGVWVWIIPFSSGNTSLGFVGDFKFFERFQGNTPEQYRTMINGHPYLEARFGDAEYLFEPRKLESWSATTENFFGKGYVLTGNVTEFLDPIFSSGVMFATVSSHIASKLVIRKLKGETINWDRDYTTVIQQGVDTFRTYVMAWYDGTLEKIFFAREQDQEVKKQICSVLAGYVWDNDNPYVRDHQRSVKRLAKLIEVRERLELR